MVVWDNKTTNVYNYEDLELVKEKEAMKLVEEKTVTEIQFGEHHTLKSNAKINIEPTISTSNKIVYLNIRTQGFFPEDLEEFANGLLEMAKALRDS